MYDRTRWDDRNKQVYDLFRRDTAYHRVWHEREHKAQKVRGPLEWGNESFWRDGYHVWKYHFAHTSTEDPSLVAYTPNDEKGERDIQVKIKPGRYLKEFFGDTLTEKQIAYFAAMHANGQKPMTPWDEYQFGLATTQQEIVDVYVNGPHSCMDARSFCALRTHPCRVYAAGDLAIAYLKGEAPVNQHNRDRVYVARALVWPDKKFYSRVYPTPDFYSQDGFMSSTDSTNCQTALLKRLQQEGYTPGSLNGARLLKLKRKTSRNGELRNGVYMPFVDGGYKIVDKEDHLLLDKNGDFYAGNQDGALDLRHPCDCGHCGANIPERNAERVFASYQKQHDYWNDQIWCKDCVKEHTFHCHGYNMPIPSTNAHEDIGKHTYSVAWLERNALAYGVKWSGWSDKATVKRVKENRQRQADDHAAMVAASNQALEALSAQHYRGLPGTSTQQAPGVWDFPRSPYPTPPQPLNTTAIYATVERHATAAPLGPNDVLMRYDATTGRLVATPRNR